MNFFRGSWKTSSVGILMMVGAVVHFVYVCLHGAPLELDVLTAVGGVVGGCGFLFTRDNDKTSADVGAGELVDLSRLFRPPPLGVFAAALCLACLTGCEAAKRPEAVTTAHAKMVDRYEADRTNSRAVITAYDAALLQAQTNFATELHNERIAQIQAGVAANPALASDGIAAAAQANLTLNQQLTAQRAVQANIQAVVQQSDATNIAQARQLDAAIRKYDNTAPFNAAAAAQSAANTLQALVPAPTPIQTTGVKPARAVVIPEPAR